MIQCFFSPSVSHDSSPNATKISAPPMYVANDGLRPQTSQSASATKKTLSTFAMDPKTGSVQMTSTTSSVIETATRQWEYLEYGNDADSLEPANTAITIHKQAYALGMVNVSHPRKCSGIRKIHSTPNV